ncbi:hypothetical protein DMA11_25445, partial [Marinilabiliaceae bacterium JC017]
MNLRKDHCRNLQSRTTREHVKKHCRGTEEGARAPESFPRRIPGASAPHGDGVPANPNNKPGAIGAKENQRKERVPRASGRALRLRSLERLSAMDISALASMKNVAKCDTWCELLGVN